jgi:hypothetical protein
MRLQGVLPILLILAVICISFTSAKKHGRDRKTTTTSTEASSAVTQSIGDGDREHEGLSAELLELKNNATIEMSTKRPRDKKHRRRNKHHKGGHKNHQRKRNRTRPTDILRADDEKIPNSEHLTSINNQGLPSSENHQSSDKLPVQRTNKHGKNGRNRDTRHLDTMAGDSPRKFTNGHHGGHHVQSQTSLKQQHRRRRNHHKKHKKSLKQPFSHDQSESNLQEVHSATL